MAKFFGTDYFTRQAEMLQSSASDEEINYQLQMLYFPRDSVQRFAISKVHQAPSSSQHACASSSTRNGDARSSGSVGRGVTEEEEDFLDVLGIKLKPAVQEKECSICKRMRPLTAFMSTKDCAHKYCTKCCKEHAEVKILTTRSQIECPNLNCRHNFDIDQCRTLLSEASFDILNIRQMEDATPVLQRVYCPFPDCSAFIPTSKSESSNSASNMSVECYSCHRDFCPECNVLWERECDMCGAVEAHKFIGTKDCAHEYCTHCCKRRAEQKISSGSSQIECPHPNCRHNFDIDQCRTLLSEASFEILNIRIMEDATPVSQRVYCPFPNCSAFVPTSKSESSSSASHTNVECYSCHCLFCLECNTPWDRECSKCMEMKPHNSFMGTKDCAHEYCTQCCKERAEIQISSGSSQIECPYSNCHQSFDIDQCCILLSVASFYILNSRLTEAAIPISERIYCPFQDCSVFIPVLRSGSSSSASHTSVECYSCQRGFCLECNVLWERHCDKCAEMKPHQSFMSTKDCAHEYCTDCCERHAESKILTGSSQIQCPYPNCHHNFDIVQCSTFLSEASFNILNIRQTEAATPASQRVYCPFPDCSVFIPVFKSGSSNSPYDTFVRCYSCHSGFCLDCKIPWHANKSCGEYRADVEKTENLRLQEKLRGLAEANGFERFGEEQASRSGGMCRLSLMPSSNFQGWTPEECHFRLAESQFFRMSKNRSKKVSKVEFIRNARLEERFNRKKDEFRASNVPVEARFVFHGTDADAINSIATEGFKIGGAGVAIKCGASYGRGVYTAVNPDISVAYCRGSNMMLLSLAVPGELNKHYNHGGSPDVLVIKDVGQLLPRYIVHYS